MVCVSFIHGYRKRTPAMSHHYDERFFDWVNHTARRSAEVLLPHAMSANSPASVVDVGCGQGTWLAVWRELGIDDVTGLDGSYADQT